MPLHRVLVDVFLSTLAIVPAEERNLGKKLSWTSSWVETGPGNGSCRSTRSGPPGAVAQVGREGAMVRGSGAVQEPKQTNASADGSMLRRLLLGARTCQYKLDLDGGIGADRGVAPGEGGMFQEPSGRVRRGIGGRLAAGWAGPPS